MRRLTLLVTCAAVAACSSAGRQNSLLPTPAPGMYAVRAVAEGADLRGTLAVVADSMVLDFDRTNCERDPLDKSRVSITYRCDPVGELSNIVFTIDRHDPLKSSYWKATAIVRKSQRMCTSTSIVAGHEQCNYTDVPSMVESRVYGQLVVTREVASTR